MQMHDKMLLDVDALSVHFPVGRGFFRRRDSISAVDNVSLAVRAGESLGVVGESGCGKTSMGMAIAGLSQTASGKMLLDGHDINILRTKPRSTLRRDVQVVFQDPMSSLNPRMTVGSIIGEPLLVHRLGDRAYRRKRTAELLGKVGLSADYAERYPHELSGGQRQRVGLARALALQPRLIVADEPVSALDVSVKAQIINLLADLRKQEGLSFLIISHDFSIIEYLCDNVAVMYLGKIVEYGSVAEVLLDPQHPYTKSLIQAVPIPKPGANQNTTIIGELPSPINPPPGCRYHPRCPIAEQRCGQVEPALTTYKSTSRVVACDVLKKHLDG